MIFAQAHQVSFKRVASVLALIASCAATRPTAAQESSTADRTEEKPTAGSSAADDGAFLPLNMAARHTNRKASVKLLSGYDSATKSGLFRGEAEARLAGPLGFRAGVSYDGVGHATRPFAGGYVDVLEQSQHGINLALHGRFESDSFNTVPGVAAGFAISRSFGASLLLANAEYGHGLQDDERNGAAGLAFLQRIAQRFQLGLDSRFQIDLERDQDEPQDEPDWRVVGGPLLLANLGPLAATLGGGVSALRYRLQETTQVGATAYAGIGAAF